MTWFHFHHCLHHDVDDEDFDDGVDDDDDAFDDEVIKPISRLTSPLELGPSMLDGLTSPSNIAIIRAITASLSHKFFFNLPPS